VAVRHAQSTLNAEGRLTGQLDPPLTALGREQAAALAPVAARTYDLRVHSGLRRAEETLRLACAAAGVGDGAAYEADARWREQAFGELQGAARDAWTHPLDLAAGPPGGESYVELTTRVVDALADLLDRSARAGRPLDVLLCTHSGVLRVLAAIADGVDDAEGLIRARGQANGAVVELSYASRQDVAPRFLP
jgi:broad specificity phosphatase PhoE